MPTIYLPTVNHNPNSNANPNLNPNLNPNPTILILGALKCPFVSKNYRPSGMSLEELELLTFEEWVASEYGQTEISRGCYFLSYTLLGYVSPTLLIYHSHTLSR